MAGATVLITGTGRAASVGIARHVTTQQCDALMIGAMRKFTGWGKRPVKNLGPSLYRLRLRPVPEQVLEDVQQRARSWIGAVQLVHCTTAVAGSCLGSRAAKPAGPRDDWGLRRATLLATMGKIAAPKSTKQFVRGLRGQSAHQGDN